MKPQKFPLHDLAKDMEDWCPICIEERTWLKDFKAFITALRDEELDIVENGSAGFERLMAKVLVMRYNEALEWL